MTHAAATGDDGVSVRRWFAFYGLLVLAGALPLAVLIALEGWSYQAWADNASETFAETGVGIKLLVFVLYLSICCTFLPLPTGWLVAGMATRQAAVTGELWSTVLVVATVGGLGSMVANLNDYHLLTWVLRSRRVARVRDTRTYQAAARWFARAPFFILIVFNVLPIPVDVVRMLATTYRYPRVPFACANFVGRFLRYGVIAFVTFWWDLGLVAVLALLALAVVLAAARLIPATGRRLLAACAKERTA